MGKFKDSHGIPERPRFFQESCPCFGRALKRQHWLHASDQLAKPAWGKLEVEPDSADAHMMAHVVEVHRPVRGGRVRGIHRGTEDVRGRTDIQVAVLGEYVGAFSKGDAQADL